MTSTINLSYIITTKNKLPYLKSGLERLFAFKKPDEEILIADGGSIDGTTEYLAELKRVGKIDYFISEPDFGESHALNKLVLVANGLLVKIISDDDVFHYPTIALCKEFMLANKKVDLISTNGGFKNQNISTKIRPLIYVDNYERWLKKKTPFSFCGLGYIARKSSLPVLGLWNISFRRADAEFTLRITSSKANIAWYSGYSFVNVSNPQSVSLVFADKIKKETEQLNMLYFDKKSESYIIAKIKVLRNKLKTGLKKCERYDPQSFQSAWPKIVVIAEYWLEKKNNEGGKKFLWNQCP